jgi:hypothetical protein
MRRTVAIQSASTTSYWRIAKSRDTSSTLENQLWSVSCPDASHCWAVGNSQTGVMNGSATLIEVWQGHKWKIQSSPNTGPTDADFLFGISCVSTVDCWTVGYYDNNGGGYTSFVEHWNGADWAIVTSPNVGGGLVGVSCLSSNSCWAVGGSDSTSPQGTLVEHWDGTSWAIVASPSTSPSEDLLNGVTCSSTDSCWAFGYSGIIAEGTWVFTPLLLHWDGSLWSIFSGSASGATSGTLGGMTCSSISSCWVVGQSGQRQTLVEQWDGSTWAQVDSPNSPSYPNDFLTSVTCISSSDCWAVGSSGTNGPQTPLVENWNGSAWSLGVAEMPSGGSNVTLSGVDCVSHKSCWAVGQFQAANGTYQTVIEHKVSTRSPT